MLANILAPCRMKLWVSRVGASETFVSEENPTIKGITHLPLCNRGVPKHRKALFVFGQGPCRVPSRQKGRAYKKPGLR